MDTPPSQARQLSHNEATGERHKLIEDLISAGNESLVALDDSGDMRAAELEAKERLSLVRIEIQLHGQGELHELADSLVHAAQQRDDGELRTTLGKLNELLKVPQRSRNGVLYYLSTPLRYFASERNSRADRILEGVAVVVGGAAVAYFLGLS